MDTPNNEMWLILLLSLFACAIMVGFGLFFGYLIWGIDKPTSTDIGRIDPCASYPPKPQCIPPGYRVIGPSGITIHHGVANPNERR